MLGQITYTPKLIEENGGDPESKNAYIIKRGKTVDAISWDTCKNSVAKMTLTDSEDKLVFWMWGPQGTPIIGQAGFSTSSKIDLTSYSNLCINCSVTSTTVQSFSSYFVSDVKLFDVWGGIPLTAAKTIKADGVTGIGASVIRLDISAVSGSYYVGFNGYVGYGYEMSTSIYDFWMEK